jgi:DNA-binding CsgD family transcriptional regulator
MRQADFLLRSLLAFVFSHCKKGTEKDVLNTMELFRSVGKSPPDFVDALCRALNQRVMLSQEQIIILRLFYEYGLTAKEIGQRLGLNVNQVNSRRRGVIQRIRKVLEDTNLDKELRGWLETSYQ